MSSTFRRKMSLRCVDALACAGRRQKRLFCQAKSEGPHHVEPVVDRVFEPGPDSVVDALDSLLLNALVVIQTVGKALLSMMFPGTLIAAEGLESVRVVIARVALAEIFPAGKQLRWDPIASTL